MAVAQVNLINGIQKKNKNVPNYDQDNNYLGDNCRVLVERFDQHKLKKKRGRPKKVVTENTNETPILLNKQDGNSIVSNSSDFKPEDSDPPIIEKKRRGRPKKKEVESTTVQQSQIVQNMIKPKKRKKRKTVFTKVKKPTVKSNIVKDNKKLISNDSKMIKLNPNVNCDISSNDKTNFVNQVLLDENDIIITKPDLSFLKSVISLQCSSLYINSRFKKVNECTTSINEQNMPLHINWNIKFPNRVRSKSVPSERSSECIDSNVTENNVHITKSKKQNIMLKDSNLVNWDIIPKRERSKSVTNYFKVKPNKEVNGFEKLNIKNYSKSFSYLDPGPNIHIKIQYTKEELWKIYKIKLKRVRSFPNCSLLDSSALNFLDDNNRCYGLNYFKSGKHEFLPAEEIEEMRLIKNITESGFKRRYRSKSVPLKQFKDKNEIKKNDFIHRSIDNLKKLCDTYDFLPITSQLSSDKCDMKTIESNSEEECNNKIRRSKRLNIKNKPIDILEEEYLLKCDESRFNCLKLAKKIREENERQLSEARKNDPELESKLTKLNFTLITNNLFRPQKKDMGKYSPTETQELRKLKLKITNNTDAYICHCKYTREDRIERKPGCGIECLNRLLNIECGSGCSLMAICTNKQFQNEQFKRTEIAKTPSKGYGVFALEDIPSGTFVDEYMGEVIDQHEMIKRMKTKLYRNNNYMVQLKHDEIIDATRKGNITRFINHSCEPNCVAEKWNVLGESRMGFFSKTLIKKGDEITFDYSFEIFGDAAQQKCYCGTLKCRGFISKKCKLLDFHNSSDDSDDNQNDLILTTTPKKKKKLIITDYDKKRLQELDQQLTNISKLKNKNRSDLENSTLNLNKLMVHITDSISRSHILKFIRENDLNCKKLFMNYNGLSIIHSWMISNNDNNLKLEIIRTLSDLPILNRNTISKSKVLDIVAKWANIPENVKNVIENLEFPLLKKLEHISEVNRLLPDENDILPLVQSARDLWKKWIVLKMVFKIPKLDRPKEVDIPNTVANPSIVLSQSDLKHNQFNLEYPSQSSKMTHGDFKNKLTYVKYGKNQTQKYFNSNTTNKFSNQHKNQLAFEWNKKNWELKPNNIHSFTTKMDFNNSISSFIHGLNTKNVHRDIPIVERLPSKKIKRTATELISPSMYEVPTDTTVESEFANNIFQFEYQNYPIEEIITSNQTSCPSIPSIVELNNKSILTSILNMAPYEYMSNSCNETEQHLISYKESFLHTMKPENLLYDNQHPGIEDQTHLQSAITNTNSNLIYISETDFINTELNIKRPKKKYSLKELLKQCEFNIKKLLHKCPTDIIKSSTQNYIDLFPRKLSFLKTKSLKSRLRHKNNGNEVVSPNLFQCIKIASNFYQNQPSRIIKMNDILTEPPRKIFRTDENNKTDSISLAFELHNKQLRTGTKISNVKRLLMQQSIHIKHNNTFSFKILNALMKNTQKYVPNKFHLKLSPDTKIYTLDPTKEIELHHNLVPTLKNTLCAKLKKDGKRTINLFKQNIILQYNESTSPRSVLDLKSISKKNSVLLKSIEEPNNSLKSSLKRKLNIPTSMYVKRKKKIVESSNEKIFVPDEENYFHISCSDDEKQSCTSNKIQNSSTLETSPKNSSQITTLNSEIINKYEIKQKPCMKCTAFQENINCLPDFVLPNNTPHLATCIHALPDVKSTLSNNELINPIVQNFKNSLSLRKITKRSRFIDDPIVRDYIQSTKLQVLETIGTKRKHKLPESILSLSNEIINLVPDNEVEIKCIVDFYHSMASVIVKILDSYVKKNCKQGRIRNDADFKYLAKKLNSNILLKELQVKRVNEMRISENVKLKVEQYIKTYMLKFGKVYHRSTAS